jgi:hypothetical protein
MKNFSNDNISVDAPASFQAHHVFEVATSFADAQHIANDYNNANKYQHRAVVSIVGHAPLRPYDPIYLAGLPNGMSGYWTVLAVKHIFGGSPADYMQELVVGTDTIGDTNPNAAANSSYRDVQSELSGQSLETANTTLTEYSLSPNSTPVTPNYGDTYLTQVNSSSSVGVPEMSDADPFSTTPPDLSQITNVIKWTATDSGRVIQ